MKVYYEIPDSDNEIQNKMMDLLYENLKLKIIIATMPLEPYLAKEKGFIQIYQTEFDMPDIRLVGFSEPAQVVIHHALGAIEKKKRLT